MAPIAPDAVTSATLQGWYDASQETAPDGTAMGTVTDRSSYGKNLTQATAGSKPTIETASDGRRYYHLDGGDFVTGAAAANWAFLNSGTSTLFVVAELDSHSADGRSTILDTGGLSASDRGVWLAFDNRVSPNAGPNGINARATRGAGGSSDVYQMLSGTTAVLPGVRTALAVRAVTFSARLHINNERGHSVSDTSVTYGGGTPAGPLRLGARNNATQLPMTGRIYEAFFYDGDLSTADRDGVFQYLSTKWLVPAWTANSANPVTVEATSTYDAFPSVAEAANGDLVAVARRGSAHASTFGDLVQWRSSDLGLSWSAEGVIFDGATENCDLRDTGLMRMQNGDLLLTCSIRGVGGSGSSVPDGCRWATSSDDGATWSSLHTLNDSFTGFSRCSTRPCQLGDGTLLWPIYGNNTSDASATRAVKVYASTDDAASWSSLGAIGSLADATGWGETSIVVSPSSGDAIALVRNDLTDDLYRAVSTDDGATWTTPAVVLANGSSSPQAAYTQEGALAVTQRMTNLSDFGYIATSTDDGVTWELGARLSSVGDFEYGSPAVVGSEVVFVWSVEASSSDADVFASLYEEPALLIGEVRSGSHLATLSIPHVIGEVRSGSHLASLHRVPVLGQLHAGVVAGSLAAMPTLAFGRIPGAARQGGFSFRVPGTGDGDPVTISVLDPANPHLVLGRLPSSFSRQFLKELVGPGQFEFSLLNQTADPDDPANAPLVPNPELELAALKRLVRFSVYGDPVFGGVIQRHQKKYIAKGEEAEQLTVVSGRRYDAYWGRCQVYPAGMPAPPLFALQQGPKPTQDVRRFDFSMAPGDQLFEDDEWPYPVNLVQQNSPLSPWAGNPPAWPDASAFWIAAPGNTRVASTPGTDYYRSLIGLDATEAYTIFAVADTVLIDTQTLWSSEQRFAGGPDVTRLQNKSVVLSAGLHTLAATVSHGSEPSGLLLSLWKNSTLELVYNSNNNGLWHVLGAPPIYPGTTAGHVLEVLYVEAASRGRFPLVGGLYVVQISFDSFVDTNGRPWPRLSDVSLKVGDSYDKILEQLAESYIDYRWQPGGLLTLDAFVKGTMGSTTAVLFSNDDPETANVEGLDGDLQAERATALMVRWGQGDKGGQFVIYVAGVPDDEHIEGFVSIGDATTIDEAMLLALPYLEVVGVSHETLSADVLSRSRDDRPTDAFDIGDTVSLVPPGAAPVQQRCVSLAMKQNDDDWSLDWSPEFRDQFQEYEERVRTWLDRLGNGAGAGASRLPSSASPDDPFPKVAVTRSYAFGFPEGGTGNVLGPVPADVSGIVRDVILRRDSSTGTTTATVALSGTTILTVTAGPGDLFAKSSTSPPPPTASPASDSYTVTLTAGNDSPTVVLVVLELGGV